MCFFSDHTLPVKLNENWTGLEEICVRLRAFKIEYLMLVPAFC